MDSYLVVYTLLTERVSLFDVGVYCCDVATCTKIGDIFYVDHNKIPCNVVECVNRTRGRSWALVKERF